MLLCPRSFTAAVWILRIGAFAEFVGHGMLGLGHPAPWANYFAVFGIGKASAMNLMPIIGVTDLALGIIVLSCPTPPVLLYMAGWGLFTALLRPLAGESAWEAIERAGNCGSLFALFLLIGPGCGEAKVASSLAVQGRRRFAETVLLVTTALLLVGHGALGLWVRKPLLAAQYSGIGLKHPAIEVVIGAFEIALAMGAIAWRKPGILLFVGAWKLATEALAPMTGAPIWVFVEHGGSYSAPLALAALWMGHQPFVLKRLPVPG